MQTETATAPNPTEAAATTQASATETATAATGTETTQQTQTAQTQTPQAAETPATEVPQQGTPAAPAVPEKYTFTAPDGKEYDPSLLESFSGAAKEAGLTQDAAQKLIEKMAPAIAERQLDQVKAIHQGWLDAASSDKEFGGEKLTENLGVARKALDNFGTPDLRKLLDDTGLGNHPEVIRFMFRAGRAISEDKFVGGAPAGTGKLNPANVLYDKTQKA